MSNYKNNFTAASNTIIYIGKYQPRKVLEYNYNFNLAIDKENQPCGIIRGGKLTVKMDAITKGENDNELLGWMLGRKKQNVAIVVCKPEAPAKTEMKVLEFKDAFCIDYKENWKDLKESKGDSANTEEIQITWKEFSWGNVNYKNCWY